MNDYDDSEDYSSANSFRARSNTWPLNRPDLAIPNSINIDEALPEIDLEEDDLFTTNENWSTNLDHDIMSWDPILNAQSHNNHHHHQQQQQQQHHQQQQQQHLHHNHTTNQQPTTTPSQPHHHQTQHHQAPIVHHHHHQPQQQQQPQPPQQQNSQLQRQPSIHQQTPLPPLPPLPQHQQPTHQPQQHETLLSGSTIIIGAGGDSSEQLHQQQQRIPPQHHQTLNNTHCLDTDDPNEYHIQQLHHLRLDNSQAPSDHQAHYIAPLSSMCIQGSTVTLGNDSYISPSEHQHHHHLQPLTSARYDLDSQQNDLEAKAHDDQSHHLHHLTSTSLDQHQANSQMLSSSSLGTSGLGLSGDLEDLDYKAVDPSLILQDPQYEDHQLSEQQHQQEAQLNDTGANGSKQSISTTSSKTKLNTPRRNAWGNMSYADLISQAINSTNDKRLTLSQIYDWMVQHVPYFKDKGDSNSSAGWKNSVRHNLSLHNRFKRLQNEGTGKSSWWTINPEAIVGKCARRRAASMEASKYEKKRGRAKKRAEAIRQGLVSYPSLTNSSLNGSTSTLEQPQTNGLSSDSLHTRQPNTGLYVAPPPQKPQYEPQKDNKMQQKTPQQAQTQSPPTKTPLLQATSQQPQPQQQPAQHEQQASNQVRQQQQASQQVHHQLPVKMERHETDSYYIHQPNHTDLQHHDHQGQQILNSNDHLELFGRHAIYMSEPCNDCNCTGTELINCGTNAMSFT